jgi:hypothetical protein
VFNIESKRKGKQIKINKEGESDSNRKRNRKEGKEGKSIESCGERTIEWPLR